MLTGQLTFVDPFYQLSRSYGTYMTKGLKVAFVAWNRNLEEKSDLEIREKKKLNSRKRGEFVSQVCLCAQPVKWSNS